jgi:hypothetical protein
MASITTRTGKGSPLTNAEVDSNFTELNTELGLKEVAANKGVAGGYASLDSSGKVPSAQLPSYVDDVVEGANLAAFPGSGETGKIYVALDTNKTYRWSGSAYVEISASPGSTDAVTEGGTNLYFTNARARAAVSASGSLSYNSSTGVFSYTAPTNVSSFTNDSGYLTGITSGQVTSALGYTPPQPSGTGASGTWGISITGNAATVTNGLYSAGTNAISNAAPVTFNMSASGWMWLYQALGGNSWYSGPSTADFGIGPNRFVFSSSGGSSDGELILERGTTRLLEVLQANLQYKGNVVLHAGNYISYSPSLTGSGASGTWGISISGNSATTSQRNFGSDIATTGQGRFTGWYDGGSGNNALATEVGVSGGSSYIISYNRGTSAYGTLILNGANIQLVPQGGTLTGPSGNVILHAGNYSSYALPLSGGTLTGALYGNVLYDNNYRAMSAVAMDMPRNIGASTNLSTDLEAGGAYSSYGSANTSWDAPFSYGGVIGLAFGSGIRAQLGFDIRHNNSDYGNLWIRTKNNLGYSTWRTVLHSGNYSSYALPLTGGALTGDLRINSDWGAGTFNEQLIIYGAYPSMTFRSTTSDTGWLVHTESGGGLTYYSIAGALSNNWTQRMTLLTNGELRKGGASGDLYIHSGNYGSYALPLSGGTLTGTIYVGTSGTGSGSRALRVGPSGGSPGSFGSYSGSWRSTIEIWDNAATRMLFLAPPDGTNFNYSYIKSTDAGLLIDVGSGGSTRALTIEASGVVTAPVDLRAPIFYDSDNTGYYLNPAGTSRLFNTQTFAGGVAEFYTSAGSLRGYINATDTDDNHFQFATSGGEDIVFRDGGLSGTRNLVIRGANAGTEAYGSMRSPIFYDSNNTGYYVDPTSTSRLSTIECGNVYNVDGGWFRNYGATGIYNQSYGNHFYSDAQNYWNVSNGGATAGGIRFRDQHDGTIRGYVYVNNSNDIGFLGSGGGWRARVVGNDYFLIDGSSIRAPLYYDSTNTSYYFRPASSDTGYLRGRLTFGDYGAGIVGSYSSYRYQLVFSMGAAYTGAIDGTSVSGGYGLWYSHPNAGGVASNLSSHGLMNIVNGSFQASLDASMRAVSDMRSPIYYDIDNTGYYVNAASTSYLYHLQLSGASYFRPSSWIQLDSVYGLYWPNNYGLHVRANDQSTYTQLCIQGSKNSYGGILDLYSSVNGIMYDSGGNGGVYREANGRWYFYYLVGNTCLGINTSTTSSSYGLYVSGGVYSTGNVVAYSDARRKTNVVTVGGALDKVAQLRGVYYTRIPGEDDEKTDPNRREIGVIAQEVNEILPEVVTYAADIDEYGVQYGNFAGLFIEAIKELKSQVAALNAEVAELRGRSLQ